VGAEYMGCGGIMAPYVQETLIAHNLLHDLPSFGIKLGWGWGHHPSVRDIANRDNRVTANHIYDHVKVVSDYGGIYAHGKGGDSYADGLVIDGNVVHGQGRRLQAIFTDGSSRWFRIYFNAIFDSPGMAFCWPPTGDTEPYQRAWGGCTGGPDDTFDFRFNFYEGVIPYVKEPPPGVPPHRNKYWSCGVPTNPEIIIDNNIRVNSAEEIRAQGGAWILDHAGIEPAFGDITKAFEKPPVN
jgi:hypothetical protein